MGHVLAVETSCVCVYVRSVSERLLPLSGERQMSASDCCVRRSWWLRRRSWRTRLRL